jgi:hypothetical protein
VAVEEEYPTLAERLNRSINKPPRQRGHRLRL